MILHTCGLFCLQSACVCWSGSDSVCTDHFAIRQYPFLSHLAQVIERVLTNTRDPSVCGGCLRKRTRPAGYIVDESHNLNGTQHTAC